jgi:hypothetical protein
LLSGPGQICWWGIILHSSLEDSLAFEARCDVEIHMICGERAEESKPGLATSLR